MAETRNVLDRAVGWERIARDQRWLTQPLGDGRVGIARPGVECRISEQGEIQGPGMMLGYYRDPAQTESGFLTPTLKLKRACIEQVYGPLTEGWYAVRRPVVWQTDATAAAQHTGSVMAE